MLYVNGFMCVLLVLFALVQYNDPDAVLWIILYGLSAFWAGLAAYHPDGFARNQLLVGLFVLNLAAVAGLTLYMWPSELSTWRNNEEVREGLGLIITTAALLLVAFTLWHTRRSGAEGLAI